MDKLVKVPGSAYSQYDIETDGKRIGGVRKVGSGEWLAQQSGTLEEARAGALQHKYGKTRGEAVRKLLNAI